MKANQIRVGGIYIAKVANNITEVRVDGIEDRPYGAGKAHTAFHVTNLKTGRKTTFRSAAKFRSEVKPKFVGTRKDSLDPLTVAKMDLKSVASAIGDELKELPVEQQDITKTLGLRREIRDHYFKDYGDGVTFISGLPIPKDADGVCRGIRFVNCDFHAGCNIKHEDCEFVGCDGTPDRGAEFAKPSEALTPEQARALLKPRGVVEQKFCSTCGGIKEHSVDGKDVSPRDYPRHGIASDAGCICEPPKGGQHGPMPMPNDEPAVQLPTDAELVKMEGEERSDPTMVRTASSPTTVANGIASKVGGVFTPPARSENWLDSVAGYTPTEEQKAILLTADELQQSTAPGRVMVIAAGAGTGKTSTLRMLETILTGLGQYTAFNAKLVAQSKSKFKRARCNTTHSLAFGTVGKLYSHRLNSNRIRSEQIARMLGIQGFSINVPDPKNPGQQKPKLLDPGYLAGQVMQAIKKFCQSAERQVEAKHFAYIAGIDETVVGEKRSYENNNTVVQYLLPFAQAAWADLSDIDGKLPFNHDCYVKVWQLGEGDKKPYIPASYILLDEAQDTAPVLLDILKQQTHALVILVGDDNQQIYDWRGAVNAMGAFPGAPRRLLSQSFRFGQTVADVANSILATLDKPTDLVMKGFLNIPSRVAPSGKPTCILCRTNAMAIGKFLEAAAAGGKPFLVGGSAETVEFCKAAVDLQASRPTKHAELSCFDSWVEVQAYVKTDEGDDLKLMVKLIDDFGAKVIIDALEKMPKEEDADLVISTAHRSKGLEWKVVKLAQDFPPTTRMNDADRRLLYVAITRAQHTLDISECPPLCGGRDKKTGEEYPGLRIRYTISMPTVEVLAEYEAGKVEKVEAPTPPPAQTGIFAVQKPNDGWVPSPVKPRDTEFTWTKFGDKYVIRGPQGHENKTVTVNRRNGTTLTVRIGAAIQKADAVWLYAV